MIQRIETERRTMKPQRWVGGVIARLLWLVGFVAATVVRLVAFLATWPVAAVRLGWKDAFQPRGLRRR